MTCLFIIPYYSFIIMMLWSSLIDHFNNRFSKTFFQCDYQYALLHSHFLLVTEKSVDVEEYNHKDILTVAGIFTCTFWFWIHKHKVVTFLIALWLTLAKPNRKIEVFYLIPNRSKHWRVDFLALGFLVVPQRATVIGMLSLSPSGFGTISASIISLNHCKFSHLSVVLYTF